MTTETNNLPPVDIRRDDESVIVWLRFENIHGACVMSEAFYNFKYKTWEVLIGFEWRVTLKPIEWWPIPEPGTGNKV